MAVSGFFVLHAPPGGRISERWRNHQSLEDALWWARRTIYSRWSETNEYGVQGAYVHAYRH